MNINVIYDVFFVNGNNYIFVWFVIIFGFLGMLMIFILGFL